MSANLENTAVTTRLEKASFHSSPQKSNAKEHSNYCTIVLISHVNKVMLKIFQTSKRFSSLWTEKFQMYKFGLERAEELEIKFPTFIGSQRKQESSRKTSTSASVTTLKPLTVWITTNCGKFLEKWEYQNTLPASWKTCMQLKKHQLELDMEQQTGS